MGGAWKSGAGRDVFKPIHTLLLPLLLCLTLLVGAVSAQDSNAPGAPAAPPGLPNVMGVRVTATPDRARLVIDLADKTEFALVSLSGPDRLASALAAVRHRRAPDSTRWQWVCERCGDAGCERHLLARG